MPYNIADLLDLYVTCMRNKRVIRHPYVYTELRSSLSCLDIIVVLTALKHMRLE